MIKAWIADNGDGNFRTLLYTVVQGYGMVIMCNMLVTLREAVALVDYAGVEIGDIL